MTVRSVLTHAAEADLREIIRYTRKQWGSAQVRAFMAKLQRGIECVAVGDGTFKDMSALYPALRMVHCEHHYIFSLPRDDAPTLVVALLHERMDLMVRVMNRLKIDSGE